jgi:hypothetical protein
VKCHKLGLQEAGKPFFVCRWQVRSLTFGSNVYATFSYLPSASLDIEVQDIMQEELQPVKMVSGFSPNAIFQPLYEAAVRAGRDRGGNALGIEADGPLTSK